MGIVSKVNRLERSMGLAGPCPECGGHGVVRVTFEDEPRPDGCPGCGRLTHIVYHCLTAEECAAIRKQNWGDLEFAL